MMRLMNTMALVSCLLIAPFSSTASGQPPTTPKFGEGSIETLTLFVNGVEDDLYSPGDELSAYAMAQINNTEVNDVTFRLLITIQEPWLGGWAGPGHQETKTLAPSQSGEIEVHSDDAPNMPITVPQDPPSQYKVSTFVDSRMNDIMGRLLDDDFDFFNLDE